MHNIPAEFGLLAGISRYPNKYFDFAQYLSIDDFYSKEHQTIFVVLQRILLNANGDIKITKPMLLAEANNMGIKDFYKQCRDGELIEAVLSFACDQSDINKSFALVKKERVKREYDSFLREQTRYINSTSDPVKQIISNIDSKLISLSSRLDSNQEKDIINLPNEAEKIIKDLADKPGELGLNIGLPIWQRAIGGLRNGSVTFIAATAKCGKCLSGNTEIYNPVTNSFFKIKDTTFDQFVYSLNKNGDLELDKPLRLVSNGFRQVYKVVTKSKKEIICTDNHPFLTCVGFKELKDLKVNNSIALTNSYKEPIYSKSYNKYITKFIGHMTGDGCCTYKSLNFTNSDPNVILSFENELHNLNMKFSWRIKSGTTSRNYYFNKIIGSNLLKQFDLLDKKSGDKHAKFAYNMDDESLLNFLGAYWDCDGRVFLSKNSAVEISCCSKSKELSKDISNLLLRFGIHSIIRKKFNKKYQRYYYDVKVITPNCIKRFCNIIGNYITHSEKVEHLYKIKNNYNSIFNKGFYNLIDSNLLYEYMKNNGFCKGLWSRNSVTEKVLKRLKSKDRYGVERNTIKPILQFLPKKIKKLILSDDIFYDKILSIEPYGVEEVFDIEVKNNHNFVANNFIIHNSQIGARAALEASRFIPVLYCDSELNETIQSVRAFGMFTEIPYDIIETGYWSQEPGKILEAGYDKTFVTQCQLAKNTLNNKDVWDSFRSLKLSYKKMTGMTAREMIPYIRRWILQNVGIDNNTRVPRALIVFDYIKLARIDEVAKLGVGAHDIIGDSCMALHDFCEEFNVPMLAFGQTNRNVEPDLNSIAGAKKISELVSSVSIIYKKDQEDLILDPKGTHKVYVVASRYGRGVEPYVNLSADLSIGKFIEVGVGNPKTPVQSNTPKNDKV